jgi:aspartate-semialdehyde dehydrogenase
MTSSILDELQIGVVGATGAVGRVTLELLREHGYKNIRAYGSWRSVGTTIDGLEVQEAAPKVLAAAGLDICFFSIGASPSRELVPPTAESGTVCIDKSSAFRMAEHVPLVVPEVNGDRANEHEGIIANPNCCAVPLTMVLAPLHERAGLRRVRVSGAGAEEMERLRNESPELHDLAMDWTLEGHEFEEEVKIREETRKILDLPDLPVSATCVRVPVMVGHAEAVWVETEEQLTADDAEEILREAPGVRYEKLPTPAMSAGEDEVLVGRVRRTSGENELALFLACDNLRKGAALNAVQIADIVVGSSLPASFGSRAY